MSDITEAYIRSRNTDKLWMMAKGLSSFSFMDLPHASKVYKWVVSEIRFRRDNWK